MSSLQEFSNSHWSSNSVAEPLVELEMHLNHGDDDDKDGDDDDDDNDDMLL